MRISRRTAISATAAALVTAPALAGLPATGDDARLLELERQMEILAAEWAAQPMTMPDPEFDRYGARHMALCRAIDETPAQGLEGIRVKVQLLRQQSESCVIDPEHLDAVLADLTRLVGGAI